MLTGAHRLLFVGSVISCLIVGVGLNRLSRLHIGLSNEKEVPLEFLEPHNYTNFDDIYLKCM